MVNLGKFPLVCLFVLGWWQAAGGVDIQIPAPQGFVSDFAGVIDQPTRQQLARLLQELKDKTGAEIVIVTVETTQPLTAFDYAIKIAEAWKPGAKDKDNGVVFLVATKDRKMFVATGYGVEGVLPDGKVGEIRDEYVVPYFKQGDYAHGILAGTQIMADLIAGEYGVHLTGVQFPHPRRGEEAPPGWMLLIFALIALGLVVAAFTGTRRSRYTRFGGARYHGGGFGGYGFGGGGFGGSGGDFGGFGGGGFGGGGAGGDW